MENKGSQALKEALETARTQTVTEAEIDAETRTVTEAEVDAETDGKAQAVSEAETKDEAQSASDVKTDDKMQAASDALTDDESEISVFVRNPVIDEKSVALYTLWFGLDYGSILTAYALYQVLEGMGYHPFLLEKSPDLWTDHYAETDNIAGKFIFGHCNVLQVFRHKESRAALAQIRTHLVGSDVLWNPNIVGWKNFLYFFLDAAGENADLRVSYASSCGKLSFPAKEVNLRNEAEILLHKFQSVSVRDFRDAQSLSGQFYMEPEITLDPIFLCPKETFLACAETAVASKVEREKRFFFTYFKGGDERKRNFILRGNDILLERYRDPLRNFIDINRYQESRDALGLKPAYHILVEDWLFYLTHSDFVMTDDYYGMCLAILFEKNFVVLITKDMPDAERYVLLLEQLGLSERLVYEEDDFKKKEYLFRKPIRYPAVSAKLDALRNDSFQWLKKALENAGQVVEG